MCRHEFHEHHYEPLEHREERCLHHFKPWRFGYMPLRGLLHLLILKILSKGPLRGVDVRSKLKEELGLEIPASAVYTILSMLEERGFITSSWEVEEKGPARKIYRVTEEGLDYLNEALTRLKEYKRVVEYLLS